MSLVNHTCQKKRKEGSRRPFHPAKRLVALECAYRADCGGFGKSLTPEEAARLVGPERLR